MKYGCIGEVLKHSFSSQIHNALGYDYKLVELKRDEVGPFMEEADFLAINVTIPYKEMIISYLSEIDEMAKEIGAVNTVVNKGGKLYGEAQTAWLVDRVMALPDITVCPHGRPSAYRLTKRELDRQFDRIK